MSLLAKSTTPVQENPGNQSFTEAVGKTEFTDLASLVAKDSYLTTSDKSLNTTTANGTITRGEYIYMLLSNIFGTDRISSADLKKASFNDCKDAGDIAGKQKLKKSDKSKDYYDSAELKYTLNNPDGGCPTKMYQSLAAAQELGIISADTRWDEGLTKEEAIQLYLDTMQAYTKQNGYPVDQSTGTSDTETPAVTIPEKEETTVKVNDTLVSYTITEMDKEMLISESTDVYNKPLSFDEKAGEVKKDEVVKVTGHIDGSNSYRIKLSSGLEAYITDKYLKEKPQEQQPTQQTQEQQKPQEQQQQETQKPQEQQPQQQQPQTQEQPQQQQPQQQQQPSSETGTIINPNTGQPIKPGESFKDADGVTVSHGGTDDEAAKRHAEKWGNYTPAE